MNKLSLIHFIVVILLFLGACSTSNGSLPKEAYGLHKENESKTVDETNNRETYFADDTEYKNQDGIFISSYPEGGEIYIDSQYKGITPLFIRSPGLGNFRLKIQLPGYYPYEERIHYPGGYLKQSIRLLPISGFLSLDITPEDALIYLDNEILTDHTTTKVRIGSYKLIIRKFGYFDFTKTITIRENQTTYVSTLLQPALFSIADLTLSRKVFNPRNPGALGEMDISFFVSSFGKGTITVTNSSAERVFFQDFPEFQTWYQNSHWNGRFSDNSFCPDGEYTIRVDAISEEEGQLFSLTKTVRIDSLLTISCRNTWNGISGLAYVSSAEVLPLHSIQISTLVNIQYPVRKDETILKAPVMLLVRSGLGNNLELNLLASLIFSDTDYLPFTGSVGAKFRMLHLTNIVSLESAVYAKATYHNGAGADTFSNFSGMSLGVPLQARIGPLSFLISPEIIMSPYTVTYTDDYDDDPAFRMWGYGRFGVMLDLGIIITGVSGAIRTTSFLDPENFAIHYPLLGAYEFHFIIPKSNNYVSVTVATEFESVDNYDVIGGFGLGFIY